MQAEGYTDTWQAKGGGFMRGGGRLYGCRLHGNSRFRFSRTASNLSLFGMFSVRRRAGLGSLGRLSEVFTLTEIDTGGWAFPRIRQELFSRGAYCPGFRAYCPQNGVTSAGGESVLRIHSIRYVDSLSMIPFRLGRGVPVDVTPSACLSLLDKSCNVQNAHFNIPFACFNCHFASCNIPFACFNWQKYPQTVSSQRSSSRT